MNARNEDLTIEHLPNELIVGIGQYLNDDSKTLSSLISSNSLFYRNFQPKRLQAKVSQEVGKLLEYVAHGEQSKAEEILKKHPELLFVKGTVTDYSGRTFEHITAFEYALWALDTRYMCSMMINCLPRNEKGEEIKKDLLSQYETLEEKGITYTLNGKIYNENHFDFSPLKKALEIYVDNYEPWTIAQCKEHWCKVIGGAQWLLPAHVAQHYCEGGFNQRPLFKKEKFERSLKFYNSLTGKYEFWFSPRDEFNGLGVNFAINQARLTVGDKGVGGFFTLKHRSYCVFVNLAVLTDLCDVRIDDFIALKYQLQKPLKKLTVVQDVQANDAIGKRVLSSM